MTRVFIYYNDGAYSVRPVDANDTRFGTFDLPEPEYRLWLAHCEASYVWQRRFSKIDNDMHESKEK